MKFMRGVRPDLKRSRSRETPEEDRSSRPDTGETGEGLMAYFHEDWPACGHEAGDCQGQKYGTDEQIKERVYAEIRNGHGNCDHESGHYVCEGVEDEYVCGDCDQIEDECFCDDDN